MPLKAFSFLEYSMDVAKGCLTPVKIFRNSKKYTTIVIWADGTKTIVRKKKDDEDSIYNAFTAALAKRLYGSGNKINKFVSMTVDPHEERIRNKLAKVLSREIKSHEERS